MRSLSGLVTSALLTIFLLGCGKGIVPPFAKNFTISGTVSGLNPGTQLTLEINGGNDLTVSQDGPFTFGVKLAGQSNYTVTVKQPAGETCTVANYTGTDINANITNVSVVCSTNTYTVGGTLSGLNAGAQVTLQNNGVDTLNLATNGTFTFAQPVPYNGSYHVTVNGQPIGETCTVSAGVGTGVTSNITSVTVLCAVNTFTIGGTVSGLVSGEQVTLLNNGGDALPVSSNGAFVFSQPVAYNGGYNVTVGTQPVGETCTVTNGSGLATATNITNIGVTCAANTYKISGTVSGLPTGTQVTLNDNGANPLTVTANGTFTFTQQVAYGGSYAVSVGTQPTGATCTVTNASGTNVTANVTNVAVTCATNTYTVSGTITGLNANGLVLKNNAADPLSIATGATTFQFAIPVAYGSGYNVTVFQQPVGESCTVTNGSGTNVTANITNVTIVCGIANYTVTASGDPHVSAAPASQSVAYNDTGTVTLTPAAGYTAAIATNSCGGTLSGNTFTTGAITQNCAVTFTSAQQNFTVTAGGDARVTATPATQNIAYNGVGTVTLTSAPGYTAAIATNSCGGTLSGNTFTTGPITANCAVTFNSSQQNFTVTASGDAHVTAAPPSQQVAYNGSGTVTLTPAAGYTAAIATNTCGGTLSGNTFTTGAITQNCAVTFTSSQQSFTLTATGDAHVSATPATQNIAYNGVGTVTLTPAAGYTAAIATNSCGGSLSGNTFTSGAITSNCAVTFTSSQQHFTVTASGDTHVTAAPPTQSVAYNGTGSVTLTSAAGYTASVATNSCGGSLSGNTFTTGTITGNCAVTFTSSQQSFTVTPSGDGHETFTPNTAQTVNSGSTQSFAVTPVTGYTLTTPTGSCGGSYTGSTYTTNAVTANCTVVFGASQQTFTVTASGDAHVTAAPPTQSVAYNGTGTVTLTPATGYTAAVATNSCGGSLSGNTFTTAAITQNCAVTFTSTLQQFTVTASGDAHVTAAPTTQSVAYNGTGTVTLTPATGYTASIASNTCGGSLSGNTFTTGSITANCAVAFSANSSAPIILSISPNQGPVAGGTSVTVTGTNFIAGTTVTIGGLACTPVNVLNSTSLSCIVPAYISGSLTKDVAVNNGVGSATLTNAYSYIPGLPTVSSITPNNGPTAGGTLVTVTGTNFYPGTTVMIDGISVTPTLLTTTSLTFTTPAHVAGQVGLIIANAAGTLAIGSAYTYNAPTYTVTPSGDGHETYTPNTAQTVSSGATQGFIVTANTGYALATTAGGSCPAGSFNGSTYTTGAITANCTVTFSAALTGPALSATASPASRTVDAGQQAILTVLTSGGTSPYSYQWYSCTSSACTSKTVVTGATSNTYTPSTASTGTTFYDAVVTDAVSANATTNVVTLTVNSVLAADISPASLSVSTGQSATFTAIPSGGTTPYTYQWQSCSNAACAVPTNISGATSISYSPSTASTGTFYYRVTVSDSANSAATTSVSTLTVTTPAPTANSITPTSGPTAGGTAVTITGTNFVAGDTSVFIGGANVSAASVTVNSSTSLSFTTPANNAGNVSVLVTTSGGTSAAIPGGFTYTNANYTIGGAVTGLSGTVTLKNGSDTLSLSSNGSFTFPTPVAIGGSYDVTVSNQPVGQTCTVTNGTGIATATVTNVIVACSSTAPSTTTLSASLVELDLSVTGLTEYGVTGTPASGKARQITITNTGSNTATNLTVTYPTWPSGTTATATGCSGNVQPGNSCTILITPGATATSDGTNPCTSGTAPAPQAITIKATNSNTVSPTVVVLGYGCNYNGGYVFAFDDTTPSVGSVGGKVVTTSDAATPVVWSLTPTGSSIYGIDQISTPTTPSPTTHQTAGQVGCSGATDGLCDTNNIVLAFGTNSAASYAAGVCTQTINSRNDWYLPAICELTGSSCTSTTQNVQANVIQPLSLTGETLWSATQNSANPTNSAFASVMGTSTGTIKALSNNVRCVRGFVGPSTTPAETIGGNISGLNGTVVLQDNGGTGGSQVSASTAGGFTFATPVAQGHAYNVSVLTQPSGQTCLVTNGSGVVASANITNVSVLCGTTPTVTSISPNQGVAGTVVTITGTGFTGATAVTFYAAATSFTVNSDTSITATAPAGAGIVNVTVDNPFGESARTTADQFTYSVPTVTSVSPNHGTAGTVVTITGTGFAGTTAVNFYQTPATSFTVNSDTSITATAPAATGLVDIIVTTTAGPSATTTADQFNYTPAITSISPAQGPAGTAVTLTGSGFTGATAVNFYQTAATFTVNSDTSITATAPAGAGMVDITVVAPGGTSPITSADIFTYTTPPTVTSISPNQGPVGGGTSVTITGTGFSGASAVKFGTTNAASYSVNSTTQISAISPTGTPGTADITVTTTGNGTSATSAADRFVYVPSPTITSVSPNQGRTAGSNVVILTGTNFTGATAVKFGTVSATSFTINSATQITANSPAGSPGTVDVTVTTPGGTSPASSADQFTFLASPTITSISPSTGPTAGGTSVTITGTNFTGTVAVNFGTVSATSFTVNSATQITAVSPAESAATVDLTVITGGGTSTANSVDKFTYAAAPTAHSLGGTLNNGGVALALTVSLANNNGDITPVTANLGQNSTAFTFPTKLNPGDTYNVTFAVQPSPVEQCYIFNGTGTMGNTDITNVEVNCGGAANPTISSMTPNSGPATGGTVVNVTGNRFVPNNTTIQVGGTSAAVTVTSETTLTFTTPPGTAGSSRVDISNGYVQDIGVASFTYF